MSPVALFGLILMLTFVVLVFALRPTKSEEALRQRLQTIERVSTGAVDDTASLLRQESLSDVPWLNEFMQQVPVFTKLQHLLTQSESSWTVGTLVAGSLVVVLAGTWVGSFRAPTLPLAILFGLLVGSLPYVYLFWKRYSRFRRFEELLPDTIDLMARALRAGHTVTSSIEMVSTEGSEPVASEFRRLFEEQNFGLPLREAMLNLADRVPLPDVAFLVTAILVQKETGGNLAEVLDKATAVIRDRFRLRGQLRVYTAQGRLTGWILAGLPFFMFVLLNLVNPEYEKTLLTDPVGQKMIYLGIILMVTGGWVIRRVIDIRV